MWGVGGGGVCCQTFYFVLLSLFSRPRAGLATVYSSFFGLATITLNVRNNNNNNILISSFLRFPYEKFLDELLSSTENCDTSASSAAFFEVRNVLGSAQVKFSNSETKPTSSFIFLSRKFG